MKYLEQNHYFLKKKIYEVVLWFEDNIHILKLALLKQTE